MNISRNLKRAFLMLFLGVLLLMIPVIVSHAKKTYDFEVELKAGYNNRLLADQSAPFEITVKNNNNENFEGSLQMIVPNYGNENVMYAEDISFGPQEERTVSFLAGIIVRSKYVNVRLADKRGNVVWSELQPVDIAADRNTVVVGVLTDDFTAVSYMDRQPFISNSEIQTMLVEFDKDSFPSEAGALDIIDVIVISDFSTDLLTDAQIKALNLWIQKGGLLIVGTGSTSTKTLSGLNGNLFNATVSGKNQKLTTLGINTNGFEYLDDIPDLDKGYYYSYGYGYTYEEEYPLRDDSYDYFYYGFYDDYDQYYDADGDGLCETGSCVYGYTIDTDTGYYYDAYGNPIAPENNYLFEADAFIEDPISGAVSYKYYDERYGVVDENEDYFYKDWYEDIITKEDEVDAICMREYCNLYGFNPRWYIYEVLGITDKDELEDTFDELFGDDYEEFAKRQLYLYYFYDNYSEDRRPDLTSSVYVLPSELKLENLEVQTISVDEADDSLTIYGDTEDNNPYPLVSIINRGEGTIAVCGIDFTKNPIPKSEFAAPFFISLVESLKGKQIVFNSLEYIDRYESSYSYFKDDDSVEMLLAGTANPPVPPSIIYVSLITLYLIAIVVLYIVFAKKKKTYSLWKVYPAVAVGLSIMIFCIGFSTRLLRLNVNITTIISPDETLSKEEDYAVAIVPKSKEYVLDFSKDVSIDKTFSYSSANGLFGNYYREDEVNYETYTWAYRDEYDSTEGLISNKVALDNVVFKAESTIPSLGGGMKVGLVQNNQNGYIRPEMIKIYNNYSVDLEDVFVIVYDQVSQEYKQYYFKEIKAGENKLVSEGIYNPEYTNTYYGSSDILTSYTDQKNFEKIKGVFFGSISKDFENYLARKNIINYFIDRYYYYDNEETIMVMAFPKNSVAQKVLENKNVKINRCEVVFKQSLLEDLPLMTK